MFTIENKLDCRESFKVPNVKMSKSRKHEDKFGREQMFQKGAVASAHGHVWGVCQHL